MFFYCHRYCSTSWIQPSCTALRREKVSSCLDRPTPKETILKASPVFSLLRYTCTHTLAGILSSQHLSSHSVCSHTHTPRLPLFITHQLCLSIRLPDFITCCISSHNVLSVQQISILPVIINYVPLSLILLLPRPPRITWSFNCCHPIFPFFLFVSSICLCCSLSLPPSHRSLFPSRFIHQAGL